MEFVHTELYNPKGSRNIDTKKKSQQEWCKWVLLTYTFRVYISKLFYETFYRK